MNGADDRVRPDGRPAAGRVLRCEEARALLMAYLDGEMTPLQAARVEDHLAVCVDCRQEEKAFRRLEEVTEQMGNVEVPRRLVDDAWDSIYRRLERNVGWLLTSIGLLVLVLFGAWRLLHDFLLDPGEPLLLRIGVGSLAVGLIVLLVSVGRETLSHYRSERYREVQR